MTGYPCEVELQPSRQTEHRKKQRVIWDTNCFDVILSNTVSDASSFLDDLTASGLRPLFTPINLLEIAATPDPLRRRALMRVAALFCHPLYLIPPEVIIRAEVARISRDPRLREFISPEPVDDTDWGRFVAWSLKTFEIDTLLERVTVERLNYSKTAEKAMNALVTRGSLEELSISAKPPAGEDLSAHLDFLRWLSTEVRRFKPDREPWPLAQRVFDGIVSFLVCKCLTPFGEELSVIWQRIGIAEVQARVDYVRTHWESFKECSTIMQIVGMYYHQAMTKYESGNLLDLLQGPYVRCHIAWYTRDSSVLAYGPTIPAIHDYGLIRSFDELVQGTRAGSTSA